MDSKHCVLGHAGFPLQHGRALKAPWQQQQGETPRQRGIGKDPTEWQHTPGGERNEKINRQSQGAAKGPILPSLVWLRRKEALMSSGTTEEFMHSPRHRAGMQGDHVAFSKLDHFASERVLLPPRGNKRCRLAHNERRSPCQDCA